MTRAVLAWTLTAAFLVTLPVTGAGQCPCRFVKTLRTLATVPAAITTALPQTRKCCYQSRHQDAPAHPKDDLPKSPQPSGDPADARCNHKLVVDATSTGERSDAARGTWDTDLVTGTGGRPTPYLTSTLGSPAGPTSAPPTGRHPLRYAHAFRS